MRVVLLKSLSSKRGERQDERELFVGRKRQEGKCINHTRQRWRSGAVQVSLVFFFFFSLKTFYVAQ